MARFALGIDADGNNSTTEGNFFATARTTNNLGRFSVLNRSSSAVTVTIEAAGNDVVLFHAANNPSEFTILSLAGDVARINMQAGSWVELAYTNGATAHSLTATVDTAHGTAATDGDIVLIYN